MSAALQLRPVTLREANAFVAQHHRHHRAVRGCIACVGVERGDALVGVAIVGRPVSRVLAAQGRTAEVTRLCSDGSRNACSMLYGAAWRAARALGYQRLITYTLAEEPGTSLRAAGWRFDGEAGGGSWSCPSRPRVDKAPTGVKHRWQIEVCFP